VDPGGTAHPGKGRSQIADALGGLATARHATATAAARTAEDKVLEEPDFDAGSIQVRVVEHASPPDAVLEEAKRGYDLVILGMHARWGLGAGLISLRRRRVLAEAPVSILAVHPPLGVVQPGKDPASEAASLVSTTAT
jgi:nucleotide-binding universal stress UspA family protein